MSAGRRTRPRSIQEALDRPAVSLGDIAHITGLSYGTIVNDARAGELKTLCRRITGRPAYRVTRDDLAVYLKKLGYRIKARAVSSPAST